MGPSELPALSRQASPCPPEGGGRAKGMGTGTGTLLSDLLVPSYPRCLHCRLLPHIHLSVTPHVLKTLVSSVSPLNRACSRNLGLRDFYLAVILGTLSRCQQLHINSSNHFAFLRQFCVLSTSWQMAPAVRIPKNAQEKCILMYW